MAIAGIIEGVLSSDLVSPTGYMNAFDQRSRREEGVRSNKAGEFLQQQQFDLGKMMSMQQYRANQQEMDWKRKLRDYMGGGR